MNTESSLYVKDLVELLPGAPLPPRAPVRPGAYGRVVVPADPDWGAEVTVLFAGSRCALRLHPRWLRRVVP